MKVILINPKYKSFYEKSVDNLNFQALLGTTNVTETKLKDGSTIVTANSVSKDPFGFYYNLYNDQIVFNRAVILNSSIPTILSTGIRFFNSPYFRNKEEERLTIKRVTGGRVWKV